MPPSGPNAHSVTSEIVEHLQSMICCLKDIQRLLNNNPPIQSDDYSPSTIADVHIQNGSPHQHEGVTPQSEGNPVVELPDAPTVEVRVPGSTPHYFHKCCLCDTRFQRASKLPPQCPNCGSRRWKDGRTKWDRKKDSP